MKKGRKINFATFFAFILALYLIFAIIHQQSVINNNSKEIKELTAQKEKVDSQYKKLKDDTDYYLSDEYIEEKARDLGMVYPDETVYVDSKKGNKQ